MVEKGKFVKSLDELKLQKKKIEAIQNREWYNVRSIFGNTWAFFYILLGGREAGKSYSVMNQFVKDWKTKGRPFTWLRLKEPSMKKLLNNNAAKFVDADIVRKYDLKLSVKGNTVYDGDKPMATVLALSTYYSDKGVALFDNEFNMGYNICLDEMNAEKDERRTFDITYAFVNQMENLVRSTKEKLRIVLIGNTLEEASDIMCCFNFIPEQFGRYYVRKKRAVIDYMPPTEAYLKRRQGTVADLLTPTASTFTNKIDVDRSMISKEALRKPQAIIKFTTDENTWFTIWNQCLIRRYNKEKVRVIAMRPYLDEVFDVKKRDTIYSIYHAKAFKYRDLITQKLFKKELELLKTSK